VNDRGVIYVAVNPATSPSPYKFNARKKSILKDVLSSIKSLKESNPNIPITVFSDFDEILNLESNDYSAVAIKNDYGFLPKVFGILNSPYERTVFLDCDTYISQDISDLFDNVNEHDICIGKEFLNPHVLNTGVISFNNSSPLVKSFLKLWYKSMVDTKSKAIRSQGRFSNKTPDDQGHFNQIYRLGSKSPRGRPKRIKEIISLSKDLSFNILDTKIWNCRNAEYNNLEKENWNFSKTKIFHMRGFNPQ
jgi:hypothetical protein